jgi:hypothetical protein
MDSSWLNIIFINFLFCASSLTSSAPAMFSGETGHDSAERVEGVRSLALLDIARARTEQVLHNARTAHPVGGARFQTTVVDIAGREIRGFISFMICFFV